MVASNPENRQKANDLLRIHLPPVPTVSDDFSTSDGQDTDKGSDCTESSVQTIPHTNAVDNFLKAFGKVVA